MITSLPLDNPHKDAENELLLKLQLKREPQNVEVLTALAFLSVNHRDPTSALSYLTAALSIEPNNAVLHYQIGKVYQLSREYDSAISHFTQALAIEPHSATYLAQRANAYLKQGCYPEAKNDYETALKIDSARSDIYYDYALLLMRLSDWNGAKIAFERALTENTEHAAGQFHLGNCCYQLNDFDSAKDAYQKTLALEPNHLEASNNLATCYLRTRQLLPAVHQFQAILKIDPTQETARANLAATYLEMHRYMDAMAHYEQLSSAHPDTIEYRYHFGLCAMIQGMLSKAIDTFQALVATHPDHLPSVTNLAACYVKAEDLDKAQAYYAKAHALSPENSDIAYMCTALEGNAPPPKAPTEYVEHLFDNYAAYFDAHAKAGLCYQVPQLLRDRLGQFLTSDKRDYHLLDLGCGTGLSGQAFTDITAYRVGIDVSEKMLACAREKDCYHALYQADILADVFRATDRFDIILAADVLVYLGDLDAVFERVAAYLSPGGYFAFTVEATNSEPYRLAPTGRYQHAESYLMTCAEKWLFSKICCDRVSLRMDKNRPLPGYLSILQRCV